MLEEKLKELTNPQRSIWLTEQYSKNTSIGNICGTITIFEKIDFKKLEEAIKEFVKRNENIRTRLCIKNGEVKQYFEEYKDFKIEEITINEDVKKYVAEIAKTPFKLIESSLIKFKFFKYPNQTGGIIICFHHIIGDAWTAGLIINGIMDRYESLLKNNKLNEDKTGSYEQYINSEKEYMQSDKFKKDEEYWLERFKTIPTVAEIPSKKRITNTLPIEYKANREEFIIPKNKIEQIKNYCKENKCSVYNFFMAVIGIYIGRVTNLNEFVIGTPILNRTTFKEKNTTGMFVSTMPFKIQIENDKTFKEFLNKIGQDTMQMLRHQKYPYQKILQNLRKIDSSVPNLYDILVSYQNAKNDKQTNTVNYESRWETNGNVSDSINIHIYDTNDFGSLNIAYDYQVNKYDRTDIINIHKRILNIVKQIINNSEIKLKDIEILEKEETKKLITKTNKNYHLTKNIFEQIEENAKNNLNKIAIEDREEKITYKELIERVNKLSNYLIKIEEVKTNKNIGIFTNRKIDIIVAILSCLKLGKTYVPIDPEYPKNRINYMIEKAELKCILTDNLENAKIVNKELRFIDINYKNYEKCNAKFKIKIEKNIEDNLYIIFTSGSTGNPKGVTITHKNMLNLIYFEKNETNLLNGKNRILQFATMSFDVSYQEIYSALLSNSTLVLIEEDTRKDMYKLSEYILNKKIDTLFIPPAYLRILTESEANNEKFKTYVKNIITAGEQLIITPGIRHLILSGIKIHNHYGPAETHVATTYVIDKKNIEKKPPIGYAISNTNILILDNCNKICPTYTMGQIAISGDCVGNGYFNNKELTEQKFITFENEKMYLTGDLGYIDEKKCVHYLGRSDFQVKINGFRIELEEIDKICTQFDNIKDSISIIQEDNHKKRIITYYTSNNKIDETKLLEHLKENLPIYMIPAKLMNIEEIPLTPNGKIDKKALPRVDLLKTKEEYIEPKTENEIKLAKIWKEIFKTNKISTNNNFFEIGGDSLLAIMMAAKVQDIFNVEITVKEIFKKPIFNDIVKLIEYKKEKPIERIEKAEIKECYPLSSAQKRIYYTNGIIGEDNIVYNLPGGILVKKVLDRKKVEESFNKIISKHAAFRTSFRIISGKPMQFVEENISISVKAKKDTEKNIKAILRRFPKHFDLSIAPILRVKMYILDNQKTLILFDTHHIIVDGTSLNIVIKDFCDFYNGKENDKKEQIDYTDFAVWENKNAKSEKIGLEENYWVTKFENTDIPVLNLPYDYPRPVLKSYKGKKITKNIEKELFVACEEFARNIGISPYMLFISSFILMLYKYTNQNNILIGTPIAGREQQEVQNIVGMFVNNMVISGKINGEMQLVEFLESMKKEVLECIDNEAYPYDNLVKKLKLQKDMSRNPLFDVMFIYQNTHLDKVKIDDKKIKFINSPTNISKFDLSLEILPDEHIMNLEYCTDLFKKATIDGIASHYIETLKKVIKSSDKKIKEICILPEEEKQYLKEELNNTYMKYPKDQTIATLIEKQATKTPKHIAIVFQDEKITYEELNKKANAEARTLRKMGIGREDKIGIMLPRSKELIISILAVLKSGATYIPIDPTYPQKRTEYMLKNSKAKLLITTKKLSKKVTFENKILVDEKIYDEDTQNLNNINDIEDSAYIIYTSGSTGEPKGVVLKHKSLVNLAYYLNQNVEFLNGKTKCKNIISVTTASFDIFIFETLIALQKGLKVILANEEEQKAPSLLNKLIEKHDGQIIQMTPSRMQFLVDNKQEIPNLNKLKYVVLAGEQLPILLLKTLRKMGVQKIYNGYGPSETTVFSSFTDVTNYRKMTIGKPLANSQIYILDKDLNLVPRGVAGELYISGDGVGKGYLYKEELTQESFIKDPFNKNNIMYKTGDSGKILPNGEIDYIERIDNQVKIRGLRIELEEIENKILQYPGIEKVKVVKQTMQNREFISAYFIAHIRIRISELRNFLANNLPVYMIPSYFTALDEFPYTPNGKIDKNALPLPKAINGKLKEIKKAKTEIQRQLVEIWEKVLNISPIGITDNFFELGGDSILAMNLHIELLKLSPKITYADIFNNPTILEQEKIITNVNKKSMTYIDKELKYKYKNILNLCTKQPEEYIYKRPRNILLAGSTGFLGIHFLDNFLKNEKGKIYCLIRNEPGIKTHRKLADKLHFYFGEKYDSLIDERIFVIKSDIVDEKLGLSSKNLENLARDVDVVVNCAAKVSHYGAYTEFYGINVKVVDNLINFCMKYNKRFYQVSTLSISGNSYVDQYFQEQNMSKKVNFRENNFYIGQTLENVYINTKFRAEKHVLNAIQSGLDGYILRIGNLMPRYEDGKFQQNAKENAYINRLVAFTELEELPKSIIDGYLEFTPIDMAALAMLKIIQYPNKNNRIFHIFNDNHIKITEFLEFLKEYNYIFQIVDDKKFKNTIQKILSDEEKKKILNNLINDFDEDLNLKYETNIILKDDFTKKYLKNIGFEWPKIDKKYVQKLIICIELIRKGDL